MGGGGVSTYCDHHVRIFCDDLGVSAPPSLGQVSQNGQARSSTLSTKEKQALHGEAHPPGRCLLWGTGSSLSGLHQASPPFSHYPFCLHLWGRETEDWSQAQGLPTEGPSWQAGLSSSSPAQRWEMAEITFGGGVGLAGKPSQPLSSAGTWCSFSLNNRGLKCLPSKNHPK